MSTQSNTYVLYGVTLPYGSLTDEHFEKLEPFEDNAFKDARPSTELTCLVDGMNGDYALLGFVHARSDANMGLEEMFLPPVISDVDRMRLVETAADIMGEEAGLVGEPGWIVITHYR